MMRRVVGTAIVVGLAGCGLKNLERTTLAPRELAGDAQRPGGYLKAHLKDGGVYVLEGWRLDSAGAVLTGRGRQLDPNRALVREGELSLPVSSVALFELDRPTTSGAVGALGVVTGITAAVAVYCATNPKACFGSCPTFYVTDGERPVLQAEGFSASIAPALEARDVDALYRARPRSRDLEVRMTNEALETHVVRYVHVLAAPRPSGARVFSTPGDRFVTARLAGTADACSAPEGDCRTALRDFDGAERSSRADSADLAAKETIDLDFADAPPGRKGLVVASRQSLMTTYLIYQALAYLGGSAVEWLAALGRFGAPGIAAARGIGDALGTVEVLARDPAGEWVVAGRTGETGPIATDVKLVPLPDSGAGPVRVRLRLTKGAWRLDWVALALTGLEVEPLRLEPVRVRRGDTDDAAALHRVLDSASVVTTLPGDAYTLVYRLPEDFDRYELFLETRGYYLEWMRSEWLAEEDHGRAAELLVDPRGALRRLAPAYKRQEAGMDSVFWRSRYARP
jgi:hypothetical protein